MAPLLQSFLDAVLGLETRGVIETEFDTDRMAISIWIIEI